MIEASGRSFDEYVQSEILEPLGMSDTFTEIPGRAPRRTVGDRLHSARNRDGSRDAMQVFQARGIAPAAGFASTAEDLARFASWQLRLRGEGGTEVLRAATLREMQRVHWVDPDWKTTWGLGFLSPVRETRPSSSTVARARGTTARWLLAQVEARRHHAFQRHRYRGGPLCGTGGGLIGPTVKAASDDTEETKERDPELDRYVGIYDTDWGQEAIVRWDDGLAMLSLSTRNPAEAMVKLKKTGEHAFRRIRKDDESLGETVLFEVDEDGVVTRFLQHSNWAVKVR